MAIQSPILSGDNLGGHTVAAAALASAVSPIIVWILQLAHLNPPTEVDQGITGVCMILASWLMQKLAA